MMVVGVLVLFVMVWVVVDVVIPGMVFGRVLNAFPALLTVAGQNKQNHDDRSHHRYRYGPP